jgi:hypothetical protein
MTIEEYERLNRQRLHTGEGDEPDFSEEDGRALDRAWEMLREEKKREKAGRSPEAAWTLNVFCFLSASPEPEIPEILFLIA